MDYIVLLLVLQGGIDDISTNPIGKFLPETPR